MCSFTRFKLAFLLAAFTALNVAPALQAQEQLPRIAGYAYGAKDPALNRAAATRLVTAFVNSGHYKAAEEYREFFEYALGNGYADSQTPGGAISVAQFKLIGQQFGIDYICVAEIVNIFNEERIFANLIQVKTAKITAMAAGDTPLTKPADLTAAANQIAATILKTSPPVQSTPPAQSAPPVQPAPPDKSTPPAKSAPHDKSAPPAKSTPPDKSTPKQR